MSRKNLVLLLCIAPILSLPSIAQTAPPATPSSGSDSAGSRNISISVVVEPKKGPPEPGLPQQDFKVLDNKAEVPITQFRAVAGPQAPVQVLLVLDAVNVPYTSVEYTRQRLETFLRLNEGHLPFPTSVALLTDTGVQVEGAPTRDGKAQAGVLEHASVSLRDITRAAGFWGAEERFQRSLDALRELAAHESGAPGRKFIIWISPGWPLLSGPGIDLDDKQERGLFRDIVSLSTELRRANITLYNVNPIGPGENLGRTLYYESFLAGVTKLSQVQVADMSLQVLAAQSGGLVLSSSNDIVGGVQRCYADGTAYYDVTFSSAPAESPDTYHSIGVEVNQPGLTARTRQGYYAQPVNPEVHP